jgi:hypothetical protein
MEMSTKQTIMQMLTGATLTQAIRVAAELEIADALAQGPRTPEQLAEETGSSPENLFRVLRALASVGIFKQLGDSFELTPMAEHLRRDHPDTVWPAAVLATNELSIALHAAPGAVRDNVNGFEQAFGCSFWDYLQKNPERGAIFDAMMVAFHGHESAAISAAYDFSSFPVIVDIAGGDGHLLSTVLREHTACRGVLFDLPAVAGRTEASLLDDPVSERLEFVSGSFLEPIAAQGDLYLLRHIIHDWSDDESVSILGNVRDAIPDHGRLLIIEGVIEPGNEPFSYKFLDLVMLTALGGKERSREQYENLLNQAGFRVARVIPTASEISILEAEPC